ncbi:hypothetical protein MKW94_018743 [Papaver nudicaule]|uniref:Uncharacterized protein n=1 Tax=Papaver nudicaule TaxID=74823 RepID=A0AA41VP86_PAPNU|nr:hypothetical protein [Papaver nudicaule]
MKNLYHRTKGKGKVYPSSSPNNNKDVLTSLLPATLLVLVSVLSLEDRQVLSYLITMSLEPTNLLSHKNTKKTISDYHKPLFDCGCFDCYTSFWSRWDSSPNRELIHQVVEAFEEHHGDEISSSASKHRAGKKKKDKMSTVQKKQVEKAEFVLPEVEPEKKQPLVTITGDTLVLSEDDDKNEEVTVDEQETVAAEEGAEEQRTVAAEEGAEEQRTVAAEVEEKTEEQVQDGGHKGLARVVLPDLLGRLNCRLWTLWSPRV